MKVPEPSLYQDWKTWARAVKAESEKAETLVTVPVPVYSLTTLPSAAISNRLIIVSDDIDGPLLAYSDGTAWRRVMDQEIIE